MRTPAARACGLTLHDVTQEAEGHRKTEQVIEDRDHQFDHTGGVLLAEPFLTPPHPEVHDIYQKEGRSSMSPGSKVASELPGMFRGQLLTFPLRLVARVPS